MTHLHHLPLSPQRSGPGSVPTAEPCFPARARRQDHLIRIFGEYLFIKDFYYRVKRQIQSGRIYRDSRDQGRTQLRYWT
jgi:hypothetical protein